MLIAGPLGLCFLPAFVCLGIVPVVAGLAGDVLRIGSAVTTKGNRMMAAEHLSRACKMRAAGDGWRWTTTGMSTVEYAIGTIAAAAFGAILYTVVTGDSIVGALTNIINRALNTNV